MMEEQPKVMFRCEMNAQCNTDEKTVRANKKIVKKKHYQPIERGTLLYPRCAIVGGGPSLEYTLDILKNWKGDIFAVNDTAGFLSEQGIPCYLYAIDCDPNPWKIGPLVKMAYLATRCHINQFKQFTKSKIRVFDMAEDDSVTGIEGGPTAVCRFIHLASVMGYWGVTLFGCESCFMDKTHITRKQDVAYTNLMVTRVKDIDYVTNAALRLQAQWFSQLLNPQKREDMKDEDIEREEKRVSAMRAFVNSRSGGLLDAMIKYPNSWADVAITQGIKEQYEASGVPLKFNDFSFEGKKLWLPQPETLSQQPS